jgi:taurine transport system substrate-binding protein
VTGQAYPEVFNVATFASATATAIPIQNGYFDNLVPGVKTNVLVLGSGRHVNEAFASGAVDVGTLGSSPVSLGVSNGLGYEVIFINDVIGAAESLAASERSGIRSVIDLKGKKVAAPFLSTAHYSLLAALRMAGVDPAEVTLIDLQPQDMPAAWRRGDIDAAYVWTPFLEELLQDGGVTVTDSLRLSELGALTADVSVVNKDFAARYPTLVTAYVKALVRTNELINASPDLAAATIARSLDGDALAALAQLVGNRYLRGAEQLTHRYLGADGEPGEFAQTLKSTADFNVRQRALDRAGDLSLYQAAVNSGFLEEALK